MSLAPEAERRLSPRPAKGDARVIREAPVEGTSVAVAEPRPRLLCQGGIDGMHQPITTTARVSLMGADLDPVTPDQVMAFIDRRAGRGRKAVIGNHNLHSLYLLRANPGMRAFFAKADLIQIDSVPLILWGMALGQPVDWGHRSTYLDWHERFWLMASERGWRVFLLGSAPGVADKAIRRVQGRWPTVSLASHHGYFDHRAESDQNQAVLETINAFRPDVILVGMGMPIQEIWIAQNEERLATGVLLSVGGAFDYEAGVQIPAPRWIGRLGMEWLFRFVIQPRRLFSRYFIEPWGLVSVAMDDLRLARVSRRGETPLARPPAINPGVSTPAER